MAAAWRFNSTFRIAFDALSCLIFTTLLLSIRQIDRVPEFITFLLFSLVFISAWRPAAGLMILAALIPIASWIGRHWNWTVAWPETLVVAFAAGYCARAVARWSEPADDLDLPLFTFAALVAASLIVRLMVLHWSLGWTALKLQLWQLATIDYFIPRGSFTDVDAAMRLLEGAVLLRAAATASHTSAIFLPRLTSWFVGGAAAASALNVWRLWQSAVRFDQPASALFSYLMSLRYNVHYPDVNAAGSYFVMALLAAIGLTAATRRAHWIPALLLIASSLMLSGSRAAVLAGALAAVMWTAWRLKGAITGTFIGSRAFAASVIVVVACAVAAVSYGSMRRNLTPSSTALRIRAEFARTTMRMVQAHPAFGVGIGQYPEHSGNFSSPLLVQGFGMPRENAHNNFLQVLGELGIPGLAALLWVLGVAGLRAFRVFRHQADLLREGVVSGLLAFVLTWLTGHPLLIDESALLFWLLLGTAAGWRSEVRPWRFSGLRTATIAIACVLLAISLPGRARAEISHAYLEHQGIGLSGWRESEDGRRYRLAGASSTVFVPSDAGAVTIPLRSAHPGSEIVVAFDLNGRPADAVRVSSGTWYELRLVLPADSNLPRFSRLELRVNGASSMDDSVLMVGKIEPR